MKPNIFSYSDYRSFFRDYYNWAKGTNAKFSHRYFSKKVGFSSSNHFYLIIEGRRNLTKDYVPRFSSAMGFSKKEQNYLETLVSFNHAKTPEAKRYYLELLHNMADAKIGKHLAGDEFEFYSKWYYPIIREVVLLKGFCERPEWIRAQLNNKVTCKDVKAAIEALLRMGLLARNENGALVQTEPAISTDADAYHELAYVFHDQMLVLAREILVSQEHEKREFSGMTMAVSKKRMSEIKGMMREFSDRMMKFLEGPDEGAEAVVQFNMQMFPVTKVCGIILAVLLFISGCTNGVSRLGNPSSPIPMPTIPVNANPDGPGEVKQDLSGVTKAIISANPDWASGCFVVTFDTGAGTVELKCEGSDSSGVYTIGTDGSLLATINGEETKIVSGELLEKDGGYSLELKILDSKDMVIAVLDKFDPKETKEAMNTAVQKNEESVECSHCSEISGAIKDKEALGSIKQLLGL